MKIRIFICLSLVSLSLIPSEYNNDNNDDIEIASIYHEDDDFVNEDSDFSMDENNEGEFFADDIMQENDTKNAVEKKSNLILLDQIEAIVYGQEAEIITKSDIERPALGGGFKTKEDIIFERQVYLDAKKHHIPQDEETIDSYLAQIQREHNLTAQQLEEIFTGSGYTIQEGRQQLQMMQMINTMLDIKIRSNLIIPRKDVEEYYKNNPTIIEATYTLQRAFVPQSKKLSAQKQYNILVKYAQAGKGITGINWSEPFIVNHSDIAESKHFIYSMEPGQISMPESIIGGFELFRLVEKTPETIKSLEESYRDIVEILRRPKYEELMEEYRNNLADTTWVTEF